MKWFYGTTVYETDATQAKLCSLCQQRAVVPLPDPVRAEQTDGTTHVCHPLLGGCNHGFNFHFDLVTGSGAAQRRLPISEACAQQLQARGMPTLDEAQVATRRASWPGV